MCLSAAHENNLFPQPTWYMTRQKTIALDFAWHFPEKNVY